MAIVASSERYAKVFKEAGMASHLQEIIKEFWKGQFESLNAASSEAKSRMKAVSRVRFWTEQGMQMMKMMFNIRKRRKERGKVMTLDQMEKADRIKEVKNALSNNQTISIWLPQEN